MRGWFLSSCLATSTLLAFACTDELSEVVPPQVCYSERRWIGGKHGHPEMYPGRDCVGCHLDNDGPPLAIGGTIYPYVLGAAQNIDQLQTGVDCFGIEGIRIVVTDADEQVFDLVTNAAGNFYVEGNPDDFAKPFSAQIFATRDDGSPLEPPMGTTPSYGGCARCHDPLQTQPMNPEGATPADNADVRFVQARIGLPGYRDNEVKALVPGVSND